MMPVMARRLASVSAFSFCRRFRFFSLNTESARNGRDRSRTEALGWPTDERRSGRTRAWRADCLPLPSDNRRF